MDFLIFSIYSPAFLVITGDASISSHIPRLDFVIRLGSRRMWPECSYIKGLTLNRNSSSVQHLAIICLFGVDLQALRFPS